VESDARTVTHSHQLGLDLCFAQPYYA
jgi:hypothetical protein